MRNSRISVCCLFLALMAKNCLGHGFPITIDVAGVGEPLMVSGGLSDDGYATMIFDYHPDAFLDVFGPGVLGTDLPGYEINGMTPGSQLFLEVIPRPDFTNALRPDRWLWHWRFSTSKVEVAPSDPVLEIVDNDDVNHVLLTQFAEPSTGPSVKVAEPTSNQIGAHLHALNYLLDDSPAQIGVYGFFARLTSPTYGPSQPFLIALNHGLNNSVFLEGAKMINGAAGLPGDYDLDGEVAGDDFLLWQRTFGSTSQLAADGSLNEEVDLADLHVWEYNHGRVAEIAVPAELATVPEPASAALVLTGLLLSSCRRSCGRGSWERRRH